MALTPPPELARYAADIGPDIWYNEVGPGSTPDEINGHILGRWSDYIDGPDTSHSGHGHSYKDGSLVDCFWAAFQGWTLDMWNRARWDILKGFRDFLREHGVYIIKNGAPIATNLYAALQREDFQDYDWTEDQVLHQIRTMGCFNSPWNLQLYPSAAALLQRQQKSSLEKQSLPPSADASKKLKFP